MARNAYAYGKHHLSACNGSYAYNNDSTGICLHTCQLTSQIELHFLTEYLAC
jgi:hypothetical protein